MKNRGGTALRILFSLLLLLFLPGCGSEAPPSGSGTQARAEIGMDSAREVPAEEGAGKYTKKDIARLKHTENFAKGALEHIFDGSINKKGKATGYHYSMVEDSKGRIVEGTRSKPDRHAVFTAKVEVGDVRKNGFSSFYPETWSPQEVVDAINAAYRDAVSNPENPHGDLWIGYFGDLEIDMYLTEKKKIITAYPIYTGKKNS